MAFTYTYKSMNLLRLKEHFLYCVLASQYSTGDKNRPKDLFVKPLRNAKTIRSKSKIESSASKPIFFRDQKTNLTRKENEIDDYYNDDEQFSAIEYIANEISQGPYSRMARNDENKSLMISKAKRIRYRTIENKYFKKEKSLNLLTWKAKEQMRHLHFNSKDPWKVFELCDYFPICQESVIKVLKSRVRLNRSEQIEWHDESVRKNWIHLKNLLETRKGTISDSLLEGLYDSNNDCLVMNANGLMDQPFPMKKNIFKKGPFSSIVSDCSVPRTMPVLQVDRDNPLNKVLGDICQFIRAQELHLTDLLDIFSEKERSGCQKNQMLQESLQKECKNLTFEDSHIKLKNLSGLKPNRHGRVYQKENSIYDEFGNFLYILP